MIKSCVFNETLFIVRTAWFASKTQISFCSSSHPKNRYIPEITHFVSRTTFQYPAPFQLRYNIFKVSSIIWWGLITMIIFSFWHLQSTLNWCCYFTVFYSLKYNEHIFCVLETSFAKEDVFTFGTFRRKKMTLVFCGLFFALSTVISQSHSVYKITIGLIIDF